MKFSLSLLLFIFSFLGFSQDIYTLSSESQLTISGTSTVHDWTVTANNIDGTLTAKNDAILGISFEVAVLDIKSERGVTMDTKMHDALQANTYPKVTFELKSLNKAILEGVLTIGKISKEVSFPATLQHVDDSYKIVGSYDFPLADYSIEPPTAMFGQVIVGNNVTVKFNLIFQM